MTRRCPTGKIVYPTSGAARAALLRIKATTLGHHRECRTYACPACGAWHTTHKRLGQGARKRERKRSRRTSAAEDG